MRTKILTVALLAILAIACDAHAQAVDSIVKVRNSLISLRPKLANPPEGTTELVIVGNDTVDVIIPEKNYGRYDRGLFNYLFVPRGQWSFGMTASYGSVNSNDLTLLNLLSDLSFDATAFSLRPYVSYFFRNNESIGMRMGYTRNKLDLKSFGLDIDEDMNFNIADVLYNSETYSVSVFYRHYIGLGNSRRFGVFNEIDLAFQSGQGRFVRYYNDEPRDTRTISAEARLNFSPGVAVYMQENISFNVSFGVFGLYFKKENQKTNGVEEGSRFSSGANFKVNLFNINFGMAVNI